MDDNGHGTHTAGTIAAASNGIGIVGVAPNVKIAGIKAGNAAGFFFPEAVVCAFMWAGSHHVQVTNNSYFADPWLFNCKNDAEQRAIWTAERRAIGYAQKQGVVVVAAAGNQADDLAHPTQDATSPDDTNPVLRQISNDCAVVPVEVSGVVGVAATGNLGFKSFYSSYGVGAVDVTAPGGDSILQRTAAAPNGRVLSTWPASFGRELPGVSQSCRSVWSVVLLPAGDVDGLAARRWCRRTDHEPRDHVARRGRARVAEHRRPDRLPRHGDVRVLPCRRQWRPTGLPGWHGLQLVQRSRPDQRVVRSELTGR